MCSLILWISREIIGLCMSWWEGPVCFLPLNRPLLLVSGPASTLGSASTYSKGILMETWWIIEVKSMCCSSWSYIKPVIMVREGEFATANPKSGLLVGWTLGSALCRAQGLHHWHHIPSAPLERHLCRWQAHREHPTRLFLPSPGALSLLSNDKTIS